LKAITPRKEIEDLLSSSYMTSSGLRAIFLICPAAVSIQHDCNMLRGVGFIKLALKTVLVESINQISHLLRLPLENRTSVES
jgi:hypothetical protein